MDRRSILKNGGLLAAASLLAPAVRATEPEIKRKPVLTIAHITDVHLRPEEGAPERFEKCLSAVKKHGVDFILNGGDSILDASYDDVKRERVTELWNIWDRCMETVKPYEVYSCLGNHDMWWKAPSKEDEMYGKAYVVKRLNISKRYYSFTKKGWHFVILDSNNENISLDEEQFKWLENDLQQLVPGTPVLLMSHYPILGVTPSLVGGGHSDHVKLKNLFYKHKDKVRICLSGHNHLSDNAVYNDIRYCCNGAVSGYWWGKGDKDSAGPGYYYETPPGYAILRLYEDGQVENEYIPHGY
ncbi:metallophosphoesterase [Chitinophaga oryziterrae]|uniref:Metallophosphoesterase n=1 Tax=Chitinophaga oryziterrae TaxID=1031224 RepID=A0A6N8J653_9BACT|nr:metallophosphoesterase [Chitinophaga oryziterrae]MVT40088.1 metallophosphoesterase [Chitinophaga oryziterrae]